MVNGKLKVTSYRTEINGDVGAVYVTTLEGGTELLVDKLYGISKLNGAELQERALYTLKINDCEIVEKPAPAPRVKRKYTRRISLGLASNYGKVTLKLATVEPKKYVYYHLRYKGNGELVWKLDEKGIYTSNKKSYKPLSFTQDDIRKISNISDFELIKLTSQKPAKSKLS